MNLLSLALLCVASCCLWGCSSLPAHTPLPASHELDGDATTLGRLAASAQPSAHLSGFRLMPGSDYALNTRVELERRAEKTLDIQYYQIENDEIGRTVLRAARDAALRGVRVRVIVDDLYTEGEDELLLAFAATPNVELRLFNPFPAARSSQGGRFTASLFDFKRVNHRMHNKLFIADNALAVAGGRNLGDHYFARADSENFIDIDSLVAGALVKRLSSLFDMYWNSDYVRPVGSIVTSSLTRDQLRARFETLTGPGTTPALAPPPPNDLLGYAPIVDDLDAGRLNLIWAKAEAYADSPDRVVDRHASYEGAPVLDVDSARYNVIEQIRRARSNVTVISPYLIPGQSGLDDIRVLRDRGVSMNLITNSLASTDETMVYTAYRRYRKRLLELGVQVWELASTRSGNTIRLGIFGSRIGRLHAKSAVIDEKVLFLGSMNFDPRSASENTELCMIIHSEELAGQQLKLLKSLMQQGAYRLRLTGDGNNVEWVSKVNGVEHIEHTDPDTTFWDRFVPSVLAPLIPESLL